MLRSTRSVSCSSSDDDDDEETEDDEECGEEVEGHRRAASGSGSPLDELPQPQPRHRPPPQLEWGSGLGLMYQGGSSDGPAAFANAAAGPVMDAADWMPAGGGASASPRDDPLAMLMPGKAGAEAGRPGGALEDILSVPPVPPGGEGDVVAAWGRTESPLGATAAAGTWRLDSPLLPSWAFLDVSCAHLDTLKVGGVNMCGCVFSNPES